MKRLWERYVAWFQARAPREKQILSIAIVGGVLWLGLNQWTLPSLTEAARFANQAAGDRATAATMASQLAALEQQLKDPDAGLKVQIQEAEQRMAAQEPRLQELQKSLVHAGAMASFLQNLLAGHRAVQLVSLETLPPELAFSRGAPAAPATAGTPAAVEAGDDVQLYKHGVRLRLAGSYRDLLAYVDSLEASPRRVLWGDLHLKTVAYPKVEMTITVFTLSLDKTWLTL